MKLQIEIPDDVVEKIVRGIMDNFPEASSGCELQCHGWKYDKMQFSFADSDGKIYDVGYVSLVKAFSLMFGDKWPKGCTKPILKPDWESWEDWLCQADATDFDAFVQLACLGEVIYG